MKWKDVGCDPTSGFFMAVFERAEELSRRLAVQLGELRGKIGAHGADRGIHGVVARSRVHTPPSDLLLQHPMQRVEVGAWMKAEILHQVLPRSALVMAMPARMQQQNVAIADVCARALDDLRRDHGPLRHLGGNIDYHPPV